MTARCSTSWWRPRIDGRETALAGLFRRAAGSRPSPHSSTKKERSDRFGLPAAVRRRGRLRAALRIARQSPGCDSGITPALHHRGVFFPRCSLDRPRVDIEAEFLTDAALPVRAPEPARREQAALGGTPEPRSGSCGARAGHASLGASPAIPACRSWPWLGSRLACETPYSSATCRHRSLLDRDAAQHLVS